MYIINTIPHGKCFVRYLRTRCFCIRNLTRSLRSLVRFLIRQQLVRKYRTPALSMKYSLFSHQTAHVNSLGWVTLFRNICIPFFSYDVELCISFGRQKHSGSQFELHTHSHLLVVNINWKTRCYRTLIVVHTVTFYNDIMIENPAPLPFSFSFY